MLLGCISYLPVREVVGKEGELMANVIIRAVDSGNIQRSPTFQAIFNHTLSLYDDFPFQITFDSGGIDVDIIMKNEILAWHASSI